MGLALLTRAPSAWGGPSDIAVRMRCPVLSDVAAAEFEARAKVDLSARSTRGGELEVGCDESATRLRWRQKGGAWSARSLPPTVAPIFLVDVLLRASQELVDESLRFEGAESAPKEEPALPGSAPASPDETSESAASAGAAGAAAKPSRKAAPAETTPEKRAPSSGGSSTPSGATAPWIWSVAASADAALGVGGVAIAGPRAGVVAQLPGAWVIQMMGEYDFCLGATDAVTVRMAGGSAVVAKRFGSAEAFDVAAGAVAGSLFATANGSIQPASLSGFFGGVLVRGRYGFREGGWRVSAGPEFRFYGIGPDVAIDHLMVWSMPAVSMGLGIEISLDLIGSR
jgi:hypothetical protein